MRDQFSGGQADRICAEIAASASLDLKDLMSRWRDLYDTEPPPRISRELLTRAIAYHLQERVGPARGRLHGSVKSDEILSLSGPVLLKPSLPLLWAG